MIPFQIGDKVILVDYPGIIAEVAAIMDHLLRVRITNQDGYKYRVSDSFWMSQDYDTHCYTHILTYKARSLSKLERVLR